MKQQTVWIFNFSGWLIFTICALFFLWGALRAADAISIVASVLFLVGCIVFIIPLWANRHDG